jgi:hypothetical protein
MVYNAAAVVGVWRAPLPQMDMSPRRSVLVVAVMSFHRLWLKPQANKQKNKKNIEGDKTKWICEVSPCRGRQL